MNYPLNITDTELANSERQCLGCGGRLARKQLIRLVYMEGNVKVDLSQRLPGRRSFYICKSEKCLKEAKRKLQRPLSKWRAMQIEVQKNEIEALIDQLLSTTIRKGDEI
ncbi:MAG: YlxR family protein [Candidatus Caenarcaniphilales bacterium]|nr:YlxR family protein [Candidatus Caenarcaniphilales bacterium]